jgi:hypothetical protein
MSSSYMNCSVYPRPRAEAGGVGILAQMGGGRTPERKRGERAVAAAMRAARMAINNANAKHRRKSDGM